MNQKLQYWANLIAARDTKVAFALGLKKGMKWDTEAPYPFMQVVDTREIHVRRFVAQNVTVEATAEDGNRGFIKVQRFVAELENGEEVQLSISAIPASDKCDGEQAIDYFCRACDTEIKIKSERVVLDGKPYHRRCVE